MNSETKFQSLLIICMIAFILPLVISRLKIIKFPVIIAEIVAGIVIGKSGFRLIQNEPVLEFLSLLGFAFLMFLSGLEIDFSYFKQTKTMAKGRNPVYLGVLIFLLTIGLSSLYANVLKEVGITRNPLFLTIIFSTTSLGIVVPTMRNRRIIQKPIGQVILISALIADFSTILLIPLVMMSNTGGKSIHPAPLIMIFALFLLIYFIGKRFLSQRIINPAFEPSQVMVRAAFALMLIFVVLAETANIEIILGAFMAGILYSLLLSNHRQDIMPKLEAVGYGFLIPVFFIMIGVNLDLTTIFSRQVLFLLPLFLYISFIVKLIPALILRFYFSWRETIGAGFLLSSRLSLIVALSLIALKEGIITISAHSTLILVAILTCLLSPILFMKVIPNG